MNPPTLHAHHPFPLTSPGTTTPAFQDCYFYMTAVCTKGTSCPFRHCEAAKHAVGVCSQWLNGHCSNLTCPLKHSTFKNRAEIECYWETHGGCKKVDCPFRHGGHSNSSETFTTLPISVRDATTITATTTHPGQIISSPPQPQRLASSPKRILDKVSSTSPTKRTVRPQTMESHLFPVSSDLSKTATMMTNTGSNSNTRKKPAEPPTSSSSLNFEVKSFEEIMREKRLKAQVISTTSTNSGKAKSTVDIVPTIKDSVTKPNVNHVATEQIIAPTRPSPSNNPSLLPPLVTVKNDLRADEIDIDQEMAEIEELINS